MAFALSACNLGHITSYNVVRAYPLVAKYLLSYSVPLSKLLRGLEIIYSTLVAFLLSEYYYILLPARLEIIADPEWLPNRPWSVGSGPRFYIA